MTQQHAMPETSQLNSEQDALSALMRDGQFEEALAFALSQNEGGGDSFALVEEMAFIQMRLGQYAEAIELFLNALESDSLSLKGKGQLVHCLSVQGEADAVALLKAFLSVLPTHPEFLNQVYALSWLNHELPTRLNLKAPSKPLVESFPPAKNGVIMISPCAVQEAGGGQNPVQLSRALSSLGQDVLFIQSMTPYVETEPFTVWNDPFFTQPGPLTEYQCQAFKTRLATWEEGLVEGSQPEWAIVFIATHYTSSLAKYLKAKGFKVAYYCLDDPSVFGASLCIRRWDKEIVALADRVIATSRVLQTQLNALYNRPVAYLPNGFNDQVFQTQTHPVSKQPIKPSRPMDWQSGEAGTVVYWGHLYGEWFDHEWVRALAKLKPDWTFNLIGHFPDVEQNARVQHKKVEAENVYYLGEKRLEELPAYGRFADVALIPFFENEMTQTINPVKAYEYLACGLTVLSRPMSELAGFPGVQFVQTAEDASHALDQFLGKNIVTLAKEKALMKTFIKEHTWRNRALTLIELLTAVDDAV